MGSMEQYSQSASYLEDRLGGLKPQVAVVLGSGLGQYTEELQDRVAIPYGEIPYFPKSHNENHAGILYAGRLGDKNVLLLSGRFHHYEGYSFEECAFYVPVLQLLGVKTLIVTNAAGGISPAFAQGELMLISDHIKLTAQSPVMGAKNSLPDRPRFFDMGDAYSATLRQVARAAAAKLGITLQEGVYAYMGGPQYETPAEVRMLGLLGADAVGMSTVPEAIMAAYCGVPLLGISCITNMAAGLCDVPLSDDDVRATAARVAHDFGALLTEIIQTI